MIVIGESDSQIIHYCKGNLPRLNLIEDLRLLVAHRAGIPVDSVTDRGIALVMLNILRKCEHSHLLQSDDFVMSITFGNAWYRESEPPGKRCIESLRDLFGSMKVFDGNKVLIQLAQPDKTLLDKLRKRQPVTATT